MKRGILLLMVAFLSVGCAKKRTVARVPAPPPGHSRGERTGEARAAKGRSVPAKALPGQPGDPAPALGPAIPTIDELYGYASWYGSPYHGRRTASGEVYNMHDMTAAHKTLALGSKVEVKNLENGREVEVRINDRGPFIEGRVIDLSYAAAKEIGLIGPGVALVKLVLSEETANSRYGVQVGAFQDRNNAERLQARLSRQHSPVQVQQDGSLYRVLVGAESTQSAADALLKQLREQRLFGLIVLIP